MSKPSPTPLKSLLASAGGSAVRSVGATFRDQRVIDPEGVGAFEACTFAGVRFEAARGRRSTIAHSSFHECTFRDCYFGPATLDLSQVVFHGCQLRNVEFMLGKLPGSSFAGSRLVDVTFRRADLRGASFVDARLQRVSFERATLIGADFTAVELVEGDFWGEPPWQGAVVSDALRYSFGIVSDPLTRLRQAAESGPFTPAERQLVATVRDWLQDWAPDASEVMLLHTEVAHLVDLPLFARLLKHLKGAA